ETDLLPRVHGSALFQRGETQALITIASESKCWDNYGGRTPSASRQSMTVERHLNANDLKLTPPRNLTPEQRAAWAIA
ncbi:unnamed protein product, partial [Hapterophycus canaliculatus]